MFNIGDKVSFESDSGNCSGIIISPIDNDGDYKCLITSGVVRGLTSEDTVYIPFEDLSALNSSSYLITHSNRMLWVDADKLESTRAILNNLNIDHKVYETREI